MLDPGVDYVEFGGTSFSVNIAIFTRDTLEVNYITAEDTP
jgi:hypothetical protein